MSWIRNLTHLHGVKGIQSIQYLDQNHLAKLRQTNALAGLVKEKGPYYPWTETTKAMNWDIYGVRFVC